MKNKLTPALILALLLAASVSCYKKEVGAQAAALGNTVLYLKYNVHAVTHKHDITASYANWTNPPEGHTVIPINTAITIEPWRKGFAFKVNKDGRVVYVDVDESNAKMSGLDYAKLITQPTPVALEQFSEIDRQGIAQAKSLVGMTKAGVTAALGYPAKHRTPSLEANEWTYWQSRFTTLVVEFDSQGKVKNIRR